MSTARDLAAHLRYLKELGVDGVSADPSWRVRARHRAHLKPDRHDEAPEAPGRT